MDRIRLEGFPRSGNTYLSSIVTKSFQRAIIDPFRHSAKNITPETFVVIRQPQIAISSFIYNFKITEAKSAEAWFIRFYETALDIISPHHWILFDDLISKPKAVLDHISQHSGMTYTANLSAPKNSSPDFYPLLAFPKASRLFDRIRHDVKANA